jgi:AhpD family alkylhydroperoxidase
VAHTETHERDRALIASRQKGDLTLARIAGVPAGEAGIGVKLAYYFTRRGMAKLAGRETEQMLEPLAIFAHSPKLLAGYGRLEQATAKLSSVESRLSDLAELKAATMTSCEYCIDLGSQIARRWSGITDEQLLALSGERAVHRPGEARTRLRGRDQPPLRSTCPTSYSPSYRSTSITSTNSSWWS